MSEENLDIVIRAMGAALARQEQRRRRAAVLRRALHGARRQDRLIQQQVHPAS
jgi:hypothetical protein